MSLLLEDILTTLVDAGIYDGMGIDAFWDKMPAMPDRCITLYEYTGLPEVPYEDAVHRSVQVVCRNSSANLAKADADKVHEFIVTSLDEAGRMDFNDRFTQTTLRQAPFKIDEDDLNRVQFGFNMGITTSRDF